MKLTAIALIIMCCFFQILAETPLEGIWLFHRGDNAEWSNPNIDDSDWSEVKVPGVWLDYGYKGLNSFGWYRLRFSYEDKINSAGSLFLVIGGIDDADETFLNGTSIGSTGGFPPNFATEWNTPREYRVPVDLIRGDNILAIRVYNAGAHGGIHKGPIAIKTGAELSGEASFNRKPHRSYYQIPFTNGVAAANYDVKRHEFNSFYPHIFKKIDKVNETPLLLESLRTVLMRGRKEIPLSDLSTVELGYINGTGIVRHTMKGEGFTLTQYAFCPFNLNVPFWAFTVVLEGNAVNHMSLNMETTGRNSDLEIGKWNYSDGKRRWLSCYLYFKQGNPSSRRAFISKFKNENPGLDALLNEINWWNEWQHRTILPENLVVAEQNLYLQSAAILKMGQSRESIPYRGQIVASLPPSMWNMAWVRDGAYAIEAFIKTGHYEEALNAIEFIIRGKCGDYKHFIWNEKDYGIGHDYTVSVVRYYGNGTEESDHNENGPNIELDGFGLTLWNIRRYIEETGDKKFLQFYWRKISTQIADALIANIDTTGLIRADSGPWERHLPGKHFIYTSACAYRGLLDAAWLAAELDDSVKSNLYRETAEKIKNSIVEKLYDESEKTLKGNLEDSTPDTYMDASAVEAINWIFTGDDSISVNTLSAFDKYLMNKRIKRGYFRITGGDWYDRQEWVFLDLRIVSAFRKIGNQKRSKALRNWVTLQSLYNFGMIAELYDEKTTDYQGSVPMCGFGAGAYILSFE